MSVPHRKLLKHYEIDEQPRFLTFSCYRRLPLLQNDRIKSLFVDRIAQVRNDMSVRLLGWVIMPEHVHLVIVPRLPDFPVPKVLQALKMPFAQQVIRRWRTLDAPILERVLDKSNSAHFWQAGAGYDRNVRDETELFEKIQYMHANPVVRGLARDILDWPWSSARAYEGWPDALLSIDRL